MRIKLVTNVQFYIVPEGCSPSGDIDCVARSQYPLIFAMPVFQMPDCSKDGALDIGFEITPSPR
jgi:hypothetical protein